MAILMLQGRRASGAQSCRRGREGGDARACGHMRMCGQLAGQTHFWRAVTGAHAAERSRTAKPTYKTKGACLRDSVDVNRLKTEKVMYLRRHAAPEWGQGLQG